MTSPGTPFALPPFLSGPFGALMLVLSGCAVDVADDLDDTSQGGAVTSELKAPHRDKPRDVDSSIAPTIPKYPADWPAELPRVVAVTHSGTACPKGTLATSISPDGTLLWIQFSGFLVERHAQQSVALKDCQIKILLKSAREFAYSVEQVAVTGFALLDQGVDASQELSASFQSTPAKSETFRVELPGPRDSWFTARFDVDEQDRFRSPCSVEGELSVKTGVRVQSKTAEPFGSINLSPATAEPGVKIKLNWRSCG